MVLEEETIGMTDADARSQWVKRPAAATEGTNCPLEEYQALWDSRPAQHSRANPGELSRENLVPEPISQLWQDLVFTSG